MCVRHAKCQALCEEGIGAQSDRREGGVWRVRGGGGESERERESEEGRKGVLGVGRDAQSFI